MAFVSRLVGLKAMDGYDGDPHEILGESLNGTQSIEGKWICLPWVGAQMA